MNVLLLGGQSPRHYHWVREFRDVLETHGHAVTLLDYAHWLRGDREIDVEHELHAAARLASAMTDYVVVAKSIGCILTAVGHERGLLAPRAALLLGFPVHGREDDAELAHAVADLPPTIVVQNEHDPFGSAAEVGAYFAAHTPARYRLQAVPGIATHDYTDFEALTALVDELGADTP